MLVCMYIVKNSLIYYKLCKNHILVSFKISLLTGLKKTELKFNFLLFILMC